LRDEVQAVRFDPKPPFAGKSQQLALNFGAVAG
jgi:hypothetical protein